MGVLTLTGPIIYTKSILPIMKSHNYTFKPNNYKKQFTYSIFEKDYHKHIFKKHYSDLNEPIII
jgi:hypothetical protein